jgi:hypothetical protein
MSSSHIRINRLQHRLQSISKIAENLKRIDQQFFWYRLTAFVGAWVLAILARFLFPGWAWIVVLAGMILVFLVVVFFHRRLDQQRLQYQDAQEWLQTQLARANLNWDLIPEIPAPAASPDHPFMNDLNLVGERSLLSLIDTCATQGGQNRLQSWFLEPDLKIEVLEKRQNLVKELVELSGFRTRLMLSGWQIRRDSKGLWDDQSILRWLKSQLPNKSIKRLLVFLSALAGLNYVLLALNLLAGWQPYWQFSLILYLGVYFFQYRNYETTFQDAYKLSKDLQPLAKSLVYLETYPVKGGSKLEEFLSDVKKSDQKPSVSLRKNEMISSAATMQKNQI